jgi:prepilin-type N-terminal cleavage/methylation domain-containing protein
MTNRRGFTLIEVIIAMVILLTVVLAMGSATGSFVRQTAQEETRATATQLAQDRLQMIQMDPNYAGLVATYQTTESNMSGFPGYVRTTRITQVGGTGQTNDYKVVTVTVTGPGVTTAVTRTTTVAAP